MSGHRISSSKLPFSSLDPPDVKRNLPAPFKPTHKVLKDEDILRTAQTPPFETLPRILIPSSKMGLKPPVMHYGWRVNRAKLLKYAEDHGLVWDPNYEGPTPLEEMSAEEKASRLRSNEPGSMHHALRGMVKELGLSYPPNLLSVTAGFLLGECGIITLYTNYDLARAPSDEVVEALRVKLGEPEKPRWYLDAVQYWWCTRGRRW
ncbi:hypothetical protein AcV7_004798 [Taiwanofungus camphoratus]|nr:hypothetical protein AcV7_004798 [Antrodia cinnamomea]